MENIYGREKLLKACDENLRYLSSRFKYLSVKAGMSLEGKTIWSGAFGKLAEQDDTHLMCIFSLSKLYTMFCCLLARDEQRLCLEDSITKYLPHIHLFYKGADVTQSITLCHLLCHTSGLQHEATVGNNFFHHSSLSAHIESINGNNLLFRPGSHYAYSNLGYDLLGYILTLVYGECFEELMQNHLFSKLGMQHISYRQDNRCQSPSGGMKASFSDLLCGLNWVTDQTGAGGFLSSDSWKQMQSFVELRKNQRSGYGFAVKVFHESGTPICCITGYFRNTYFVQMWSAKYRMGYIGIFYGFTEVVRKALDTHDVLFNQIQEMESQGRVTEKSAKRRRKMKPLRPIQLDGIYISLSGRILCLRQTVEAVSLSWDQRVWESIEWDNDERLIYGCVELILDHSRDRVSGIFYNAAGNFDYFFYNCPLNLCLPPNEEAVERIFALDLTKAKTEETRSHLRMYNRVNRIVLTYTADGLYLNRLYMLEHLKDNVYLKSTGEPVMIEDDAIWVGNLKYVELPMSSPNNRQKDV
mgnify:CR=1 FL=1